MPHDWLWYTVSLVYSNISLCLFTEFSHLAEPESSAQRWSSGLIRDLGRLWISWTGRKMQCQSNIHEGLTIKSASTSRKAMKHTGNDALIHLYYIQSVSLESCMTICNPSYRACHGLPAMWEAHKTTICAWPWKIRTWKCNLYQYAE